MEYKNYTEYLKSDHWQQVRKEKWDHSPHKCRICGACTHLVIHHRDYSCLGHENITTDLVILCAECHHEVHFYSDGTKVDLTRADLVARENYLYHQRRDLKYRLLTTRPSEVINYFFPMFKSGFKLTYRVLKKLW